MYPIFELIEFIVDVDLDFIEEDVDECESAEEADDSELFEERDDWDNEHNADLVLLFWTAADMASVIARESEALFKVLSISESTCRCSRSLSPLKLLSDFRVDVRVLDSKDDSKWIEEADVQLLRPEDIDDVADSSNKM